MANGVWSSGDSPQKVPPAAFQQASGLSKPLEPKRQDKPKFPSAAAEKLRRSLSSQHSFMEGIGLNDNA